MKHTSVRARLAVVLLALAISACGDASGNGGRTLTVMSYNIYLGGKLVVNDLAATAAVIEAAGADLVGLQEQLGSAEQIAQLLGFHVDPTTGKWDALSGVNVTLGLPLIRTSVDHGTAFDIAGKGIASERSLIEAILWHDGEAAVAQRRFVALSAGERRDLLRFLGSL